MLVFGSLRTDFIAAVKIFDWRVLCSTFLMIQFRNWHLKCVYWICAEFFAIV